MSRPRPLHVPCRARPAPEPPSRRQRAAVQRRAAVRRRERSWSVALAGRDRTRGGRTALGGRDRRFLLVAGCLTEPRPHPGRPFPRRDEDLHVGRPRGLSPAPGRQGADPGSRPGQLALPIRPAEGDIQGPQEHRQDEQAGHRSVNVEVVARSCCQTASGSSAIRPPVAERIAASNGSFGPGTDSAAVGATSPTVRPSADVPGFVWVSRIAYAPGSISPSVVS